MSRPISLIPYYGGAYDRVDILLEYVLELANSCSANGFIELTGGGARVLLNLPYGRFSYIQYNEWDIGLCNLFACVQNIDSAEKLVRVLSELPYSKKMFEFARTHKSDPDLSILKSAALTYIGARLSFSSNLRTFEINENHPGFSDCRRRYYNHLDKIYESCRPLENVVVTNGDFRNILEKFSQERNFIKFLDPPYHPATRATIDTYPCELSRADHQEMVSILSDARCWILCGYDPAQFGCDDYAPLEKSGARKISLGKMRRSIGGKRTGEDDREQFLWIKD